MSGYLQRMATSVAQPTRAVHAMVPGIFGKESSRDAGPETGEVETLVETQGETLHTVQSELRSSARKDEAPLGSRQARATDQGTSISPRELLVAGWKPTVMPERRVERVAMEQTAEVDGAHAGRGAVSDERVKTQEQGADGETKIFTPVVKRADEDAEGGDEPPARIERALKPEVIRAVDGRREVAVRQSEDKQGARGDEAKRGSEDIQIHIGRIEVIAVPQTSQRAAPAKVQRGETLEAYLKRHDRRLR